VLGSKPLQPNTPNILTFLTRKNIYIEKYTERNIYIYIYIYVRNVSYVISLEAQGFPA
jgi:hypothetical protein